MMILARTSHTPLDVILGWPVSRIITWIATANDLAAELSAGS